MLFRSLLVDGNGGIGSGFLGWAAGAVCMRSGAMGASLSENSFIKKVVWSRRL